MGVAFPYLSRLGGGNENDSEFRQIVEYYASDGVVGALPSRFMVHIVAEKWGCTPDTARQASAQDFFDALLFHGARGRGESDKAANDRALEGV